MQAYQIKYDETRNGKRLEQNTEEEGLAIAARGG